MFAYLEDFGLGFDRNDLSTAKEEHLPIINEKGMCMHYGLVHEKFMWDIRQEQGVKEVFEKIYQTEDLIVSFDAANFTFPNPTDIPPNKRWPHQDLVNLLPNGPNDGGLIVCKGGHLLSEQFHNEMRWETRIHQWTNEWYGFTENGMKWLKDQNTEWIKVCAEPGDLLIWDSRTPHYNLSSTSSLPRFCVYTCYMPVSDATQEDLIRKKAAFEAFVGTTHWPNANHTGGNKAMRGGAPDPHNRDKPKAIPEFDSAGFKLTGIPYIKA